MKPIPSTLVNFNLPEYLDPLGTLPVPQALGAAPDDDIVECVACWTALHPETFVPTSVVPLSFYQELEVMHNDLITERENHIAQIEDYSYAHQLSKEAIVSMGVRNAELTIEIGERKRSAENTAALLAEIIALCESPRGAIHANLHP